MSVLYSNRTKFISLLVQHHAPVTAQCRYWAHAHSRSRNLRELGSRKSYMTKMTFAQLLIFKNNADVQTLLTAEPSSGKWRVNRQSSWKNVCSVFKINNWTEVIFICKCLHCFRPVAGAFKFCAGVNALIPPRNFVWPVLPHAKRTTHPAVRETHHPSCRTRNARPILPYAKRTTYPAVRETHHLSCRTRNAPPTLPHAKRTADSTVHEMHHESYSASSPMVCQHISPWSNVSKHFLLTKHGF